MNTRRDAFLIAAAFVIVAVLGGVGAGAVVAMTYGEVELSTGSTVLPGEGEQVPVDFTPAQKAQWDRLSAARQEELREAKLIKRTPDELRARVNILAVGGDVRFAPENDYSPEDAALIQAVRPRSEWMLAVPLLLEEAATLRAEGMSEKVIAVILGR